MTIATILAFFKTKLGKATIIASIVLIVVLVFSIIIASKTIEINKKAKQIEEQKDFIEFLELERERLKNEIEYIKESEILSNYYTNSSLSIKKIEREKLTGEEHVSINKLSNDFYNYYSNNKLPNSNKIYKSSSIDSAREIFYSANIRQARINESLSRVGNENIAMATLV